MTLEVVHPHCKLLCGADVGFFFLCVSSQPLHCCFMWCFNATHLCTGCQQFIVALASTVTANAPLALRVKYFCFQFRQQKEDGGNWRVLGCKNEARGHENVRPDRAGSSLEDNRAGPQRLLQHVWRSHHGSGTVCQHWREVTFGKVVSTVVLPF